MLTGPRRSSRGQTEGPGVVNWRLLPIELQKVNLLLIVIIGDINQLFKQKNHNGLLAGELRINTKLDPSLQSVAITGSIMFSSPLLAAAALYNGIFT